MKAIALFSRGLDSILAIKLVQAQGIGVVALHLLIPFYRGHTQTAGIRAAADSLGIDLKLMPLGQDYLEIIKNPKHGYGKNLNPCIDCRIFMLRRAKEVMCTQAASFIVTGEVLGQRPKSQKKDVFSIIERESELAGLILRPLSAQLLPPTIAESKGWVKRDELLGICGRGRTPQISLARRMGIENYPQPGGGCLLTDSSFCRRLEDSMQREELNLDNVELLKVGRHFRLTPSFKLVVGRDQGENEKIINLLRPGDLYFEPACLPGPSGLGRGVFNEDIKRICARIIAMYTAPRGDVKIVIKADNQNQEVLAAAAAEKEIQKFIL